MTFFYKFWKKARVYYTLSISRGGAQAPGPPPLDSPLGMQTYNYRNTYKIYASHLSHGPSSALNNIPWTKGVNPCWNMGGIILGRNIHQACGMYCALRRALLGGFGGMLHRKFFFKWCNLVRFGVYLDQILSLQNFKSYYFLYKK